MNGRMWSRGLACFGGMLILLTGACSSDDEATCAATYPPIDASTTNVLYVAAGCSGSGTADAPFATISEALAVASTGSTIVVADGVYEENLVIATPDITIVGRLSTDTASADIILQNQSPESSSIILQAPSPENAGIILQIPSPEAVGIILQSKSPEPTILVNGVSGVVLRGIRTVGAQSAGISLRNGAEVLVSQCRVESTESVENVITAGIIQSEGASIILQHTAVTGTAGMGLFSSTGGSTHVFASLFSDNAAEGIRVESAPGPVVVDVCALSGNGIAGVAIMSTQGATIQRTAISTTRSVGGKFGDGITVGQIPGAPTSDATVGGTDPSMGNQLTGNARAGMLLDAGRAIILQNNAGDNEGPGLWIQNTAQTVEVGSNTFASNRIIGIGVYGATDARIDNNTISNTRIAPVVSGTDTIQIGDGVALLAGASGALTNNTIQGNGRTGVLLEAVDGNKTTVTGNRIQDNGADADVPPGGALGIILQRPKPDSPVVISASASCDPGTAGCNLLSGNAGGDVIHEAKTADEEVGLAQAAREGYELPQ